MTRIFFLSYHLLHVAKSILYLTISYSRLPTKETPLCQSVRQGLSSSIYTSISPFVSVIYSCFDTLCLNPKSVELFIESNLSTNTRDRCIACKMNVQINIVVLSICRRRSHGQPASTRMNSQNNVYAGLKSTGNAVQRVQIVGTLTDNRSCGKRNLEDSNKQR